MLAIVEPFEVWRSTRTPLAGSTGIDHQEPSSGAFRVESRGFGIENERVTGKTFMRFRGPQALNVRLSCRLFVEVLPTGAASVLFK